MNVFDTARTIPAVDVLTKYTAADVKHIGRKDVCCCPLPNHNEKTPSCYFYEDGGWHCFGCGRGGSSIDLVMNLSGSITVLEAAKKICEDFNLDYDGKSFGGNPSAKEINKEESNKSKQEAYRIIVDEAYRMTTDYMHLLGNRMYEQGKTEMFEEEASEEFYELIEKKNTVDAVVEKLADYTSRNKYDLAYRFIREHKEQIISWRTELEELENEKELNDEKI